MAGAEDPAADAPPQTRSGFVALLGAPNAGKSTLVNQLVGTKVSIVTHKVQTTRALVRGIATHGAAQIVFIDTPGKMDSASTEAAKHANMVLIPTQAQIFAIDTLEPLKRLLDMAGNPPAFVVLNLVHPNAGGRAADDAAAIAERFNVAVAPIHMSRLKAYEDAPALGQTPQELEPQGRAAQEVAGLFTFLSEQASMIAGNHERMKA